MDEALSQTLTEIKVELAKMNSKLDLYMFKADDHETRLRKVERLVWTLSTVAMISGGAAGTVVSQFLGG